MLCSQLDNAYQQTLISKLFVIQHTVEMFDELDDNFKELASMLNFRDKETVRKDYFAAKKAGTLSQTDKEMDDWDKEMKVSILYSMISKAT